MKIGFIFSAIIVLACSFFPVEFLRLFTNSTPIIQEGCDYLYLMQWTFVLFIFSSILMSTLRSVETVKISFYISVMSLIVNAGINYTLIFGNFGFPQMGITGAAIGTLVARVLELAVIVFYLFKLDTKIRIFTYGNIFKSSAVLKKDFYKVLIPIIINQTLWAVSIPIQTAILGHLSDDAIASNSISST